MEVGLRGAITEVATTASGERSGVLLRLLFPIVLLEAALWAPRPLAVLCGICALWYVSWHLWEVAGKSAALGLDLRGLLKAPVLLGATSMIAIALLAAAYYSGSLHRLWGLQNPWYAALGYVCWALIQEFMLQCFCFRMLRVLVSRVGSLLLSGVVFSIAHLPNPSLTLLTFFAGIAFTFIYVRKRNLYVVALIHAILGLTLAVSAPDAWFHGLRVGRDFLEGPRAITAEAIPRR